MTQPIQYKPQPQHQILVKESSIDRSTGVSWCGFWLAIAAMNITSQIIKAGLI